MKKLLIAAAASSLVGTAAVADPGGQTSIDLVLEGNVSPVLSIVAAQADVNVMTGGNTQQVALLTVSCNLPGNIQLSVTTANDFELRGPNGSILDYGIRVSPGTSVLNATPASNNVISEEPNQAGGTETGTIDCTDAGFDDGSEQFAFGVIKLGSTATAGAYTDTVTIEVASLLAP